MSKNKHTPGPWEWRNGTLYSGESGIIEPWRFCDEPGVAVEPEDAQLIAAAPNLLEACKTALAFLAPHTMAHQKLRDAIAEAEGE